MRYISKNKSAALLFPNEGKSKLTFSYDSCWGINTSSKGTSGALYLINNSLIKWWSNKQTVTTQSACEVEYAAFTKLAVAKK